MHKMRFLSRIFTNRGKLIEAPATGRVGYGLAPLSTLPGPPKNRGISQSLHNNMDILSTRNKTSNMIPYSVSSIPWCIKMH